VRRPVFTRDVVIIGGCRHVSLPLAIAFADRGILPGAHRRGQGDDRALRATRPVAVVTMADGCDDARQIDDLTRLAEREVVVAAASWYMAGTV
jgi:dolichol-phosphate mannosyltransferase